MIYIIKANNNEDELIKWLIEGPEGDPEQLISDFIISKLGPVPKHTFDFRSWKKYVSYMKSAADLEKEIILFLESHNYRFLNYEEINSHPFNTIFKGYK